MTTVVAIYTGHGLADPLKALFNEELPEIRLFNIADDSLIQHVIRDGKVTQSVAVRLTQYYKIAVDIGADYILNTCSSVGEVADTARKLFDTPILKIDEPMAIEAVKSYEKIAVLATLPTTLKPTVNLIKRQADQVGKRVSVIEGLAEGAYQALIEKRPDKHDELILQADNFHRAWEVDVKNLLKEGENSLYLYFHSPGKSRWRDKKRFSLTGPLRIYYVVIT